MLLVTTIYSQDIQDTLGLNTILAGSSFSENRTYSYTDFSFRKASQSNSFTHLFISDIPRADYLPSLFCKLEYQLESKSKLAPRFRLGSLQYTNWMEGKGDFYTRYYK